MDKILTDKIRRAATIVRAMSPGGRIKTLEAIINNPGCYQEDIEDATGIDQSIISQYTKALCAAGLLCKDKQGKYVHHYPILSEIKRVNSIASRLAAFWDEDEVLEVHPRALAV